MTREEHLEWCKKRALEYINDDDPSQAWASFASDMSKHDETAKHIALELGARMIFSGHLNTKQEMRRFIEGFH